MRAPPLACFWEAPRRFFCGGERCELWPMQRLGHASHGQDFTVSFALLSYSSLSSALSQVRSGAARCPGETFYPRPTLTIGARRFKSGSTSGLLPLLPARISWPRVGPPPDLNLPGARDELQQAVNCLRVIKVV